MKKLLSLLFVLMMMLPAAYAEEESAPLMEVHQMAIGYADGYFIRVGDVEIMIDGGKPVPFARNDDVMNNLAALGATELDMYIVTHWHLDHCENVNVVLEKYGTPETAVYSPSEKVPEKINDGKKLERYLYIAPLVTGVHKQMKQGDVINIGPLTITCVGPERVKQEGKVNGDSLNFVLQYGTRRILFTGDYTRTQDIQAYEEICSQVDVLKFPHHGGEPFEIKPNALRIVDPTYVLMPSNLNNYKVFTYIRDNGMDILRENVLSQREGHIVVVTDGGDLLEVRTQQNPAEYAPKTE